MKYALIENDIVVQIQSYSQSGFVQVPDIVICGMKKNGTSFENIEKTVEQLSAEMKIKTIEMIDSTIQNEVDKYNIENGVLFASIHNCHTYSTVADYPHQPFCASIVQWNADLWKHMRAWENTLSALPTFEEINTELNKVPFNA